MTLYQFKKTFSFFYLPLFLTLNPALKASLEGTQEESKYDVYDNNIYHGHSDDLDNVLHEPGSEIVYKYDAVLLGDGKVGKTSLFERLKKGNFKDTYIKTTAPSSMVQHVNIDNQSIELTIYDTAGQEEFAKISRTFYRKANCFILCYDVNNSESFYNCKEKWMREIEENVGKKKPFLLLCGTKTDKEDLVSDAEVLAFKEKLLKFDFFMKISTHKCSAKANRNIDSLGWLIAKTLIGYEPRRYGKHMLRIGDYISYKKHCGIIVETLEDSLKVDIETTRLLTINNNFDSIIILKKTEDSPNKSAECVQVEQAMHPKNSNKNGKNKGCCI